MPKGVWRSPQSFVGHSPIDRCLAVYPMSAWLALAAKVDALSTADADARQFKRIVFAEAVDGTLDGQGRIVVPPELRRYAGIEREVFVVGVNTSLEIWDAARWEALNAAAEDEGADIAQRLAALL
jgi:MraZ protein